MSLDLTIRKAPWICDESAYDRQGWFYGTVGIGIK